MSLFRKMWQRYLSWRQAPGAGRPVAEATIVKVAIAEDEAGLLQRGLGASEGSSASG